MSALIKLLPSGKEFVAEGTDTLLEAALRSGLSLQHSCNNGSCGKCKAKLLSGAIEQLGPQDYHFSESERSQNHILLCRTAARSDLELQVQEANSPQDIPRQRVATRVEKLQHVSEDVMLIHLRTPRSQTLQFLAGQHAELGIDGVPPRNKSIASCPCNAMHLEFHVRMAAADPFSGYVFNRLKLGDSVTVTGPRGTFLLDEASARPIIFFAYETGFGPIQSIIQHAFALELAQPIYLYWLTSRVGGHYLDNYCRSWEDAIDNFSYVPLIAQGDDNLDPFESPESAAENFTLAGRRIASDHPQLSQFDIYLSGPEPTMRPIMDELLRAGALGTQLRVDFMQRF